MDEEKDAAYPCGVNSLFSKGKGQSLVFSHNEHSEFPLDDIHVNLQCSSCHTISEQVVYRPLATTCAECHSEIENYLEGKTTWVEVNPDPHAGRVACTDCHLTDKPAQSPAEYAQRCASCHNQHYRDLFYDWSKSLHNRQMEAEESLDILRKENARDIDELGERYKMAKIVGLHNVSLATRIYSDSLQESK